MPEDLTHTAGPDTPAVAQTSTPPTSPPGYELLDEIGHGGMGVVYRARDVALDRDVAVKLLSERYPPDSLPAQRFLSEARITGQLQHPGIPAVHQVGTLADGRPFLAMKLIKGSTLEAILKQRPHPSAAGIEKGDCPSSFKGQSPFSMPERGRLLAVFEAVCQAVGYAHAHHVIHRDLKPANVMVGSFGEVQVMDWGLAKVLGEESPATAVTLAAEQTQAWTQVSPTPESGSHTQAGSLVGTPAFIPPEQAVGQIERVNERSDVFGLGALLAVILTGKPPYVGESSESVRVQALRGKLDDCFARLDACGAEPELVALCKRCLAFEPAERPADAGAVAQAVARLRAAADERARRAELERVRLEGEQATAEARAAERRKRRRLALGAAAALVLVLAGGTTVSYLKYLDAQQQQARAEAGERKATNALALVESQKAEVEASLSKAEAAERLARAAVEEGRQLQYMTDMQLAPFVWKDDRTTAEQLRILLAKHVPESNAAVAKPDLRGFEWHYYQHLLQRSATVFTGPSDPVIDGVFTSNGQLLTMSSNGRLRRWDQDTQDEDETSHRDLPGGASAQAGVLSPDGRLAALGVGAKVHIFDTSTGKETLSIASANEEGRLLSFSRDGNRLVIVDDKIRWCNSLTGEVIASFDRKFGKPRHLGLSADGLTLAVAGHGDDNRRSSIYRLDATAKRVTLLKEFGGGTISGAALSPDGQRLVTSYWFGGDLFVYETATGRMIARVGTAHACRISAIAFSDDGKKLASADEQGTIKAWADAHHLTSKSTALRTLKGHQGSINSVRFSLDGKRLFSSGWKRAWEHKAMPDRTARVWNLENGATAFRPLDRSSHPGVARLSPDGLLIADADGRGVHLWDAATGRLVRFLPAVDMGRVHSLAFSPTDSRLLAVGAEFHADDSHVSLWDLDAGEELARLAGATDLPGFKSGTGAVGALAFSPDGKYLVAGFGGRIGFPGWSWDTPCPLKVWEVATRRPIRRLAGHTRSCSSIDFSSDGKLLASAGYDDKAIIWSTKTWKATQTLHPPIVDSLPHSMAFSPDGKMLAVGDQRGNIHWWDVATGHLLETVSGHATSVGAMVFSPDGRTLASGSEDQTVRLWNVPTRRQLMQLDPGSVKLGTVQTLDFSPDGKQLLAGGTGSGGVWSTAPILWNDPDRAAKKLRLLLKSNADFKSRIRMFSENLRLHEALAKLDMRDLRVQAALAATQANWHASRHAWPEAALAFDRLLAADPTQPDAWLRTPGLLRLATALLHQDRPLDAARLLQGGAERRRQDGLPAMSRSDRATGELLSVLEKRLAESPRDAGLLELRAELAGQWSDWKAQLADYTAAIKTLAEQPAEAASAHLRRLYRCRGDAYLGLQKWTEAVDDYAHVITPETTDVELLSKRARAHEALKHWQAAEADWSRVATGNPLGARRLAEFARRLAAAGQVPLAEATRTKARALFEEDLAKHPENSSLAAELADLLLGRFRLSVSDDPAAVAREGQRLAAMKLTYSWGKLAAAYHVLGDQQALDKLLKRHPAAVAGIGDLHAAYQDWERAIAEYRKAITDQPADDACLTKLLKAYQSAGRTEQAIPYLAKASAANPNDTSLSLKVAALQAWFGQDKELAESCGRALEFARGRSDPTTADRMAKICCLRPTQDKSRLGPVLALARQAVNLGKTDQNLPWFQMALGMAEYRNGHFPEADAVLLAAANSGKDNPYVAGTSAYFRAMSLFRQGKVEEARKLAIAAAAKMKPLPKDENNPLAGNAGHDDLILWLAYKEAKALLKLDAAPPPEKK